MAAQFRRNCQPFVTNHIAVEIGTDYVGIESGKGTFGQLVPSSPVVYDVVSHLSDSVLGGLQFLFLNGLGICIHERKTDISVGHHNRITTVEMEPIPLQFFAENGHCLPRFVATGADCIAEWYLLL